MKVIQVIAGLDQKSGGPSYVLPRLCEALGSSGIENELHTLLPLPNKKSTNYHMIGHPKIEIFRSLNVSPALRSSLLKSANHCNLIHNHGLWLMPNFYAAEASRKNGCPLVISTHGTLADWALKRSRVKKRIISYIGQNNILHSASCFHATSISEYQDIRRYGIKAPVAIIPIGVDLPTRIAREQDTQQGLKRLLYLGRMHPVKGLDNLLKAWKGVQNSNLDWQLVLCGPDENGYKKHLEKVSNELGLERIEFRSAVYGEGKNRLLSSSDILVLPSYSENFSLVIAEALIHGVPVITTKGVPWGGIEQYRCGWWIDVGEIALEECLREALLSNETDLHEMGTNGMNWVKKEFSWNTISAMMHETYTWLLGGGQSPSWVYTH